MCIDNLVFFLPFSKRITWINYCRLLRISRGKFLWLCHKAAINLRPLPLRSKSTFPTLQDPLLRRWNNIWVNKSPNIRRVYCILVHSSRMRKWRKCQKNQLFSFLLCSPTPCQEPYHVKRIFGAKSCKQKRESSTYHMLLIVIDINYRHLAESKSRHNPHNWLSFYQYIVCFSPWDQGWV